LQRTRQHTAAHCNTLQHTATHCSTLQHTATHCSTLQHTTTHDNTLQHTTTHGNTLQHTHLQDITSPSKRDPLAPRKHAVPLTTCCIIVCRSIPPGRVTCKIYCGHERPNPCTVERERNKMQHSATHCNTREQLSSARSRHCCRHSLLIDCVAVCCSVLQCVAVCCRVLPCVAVLSA